MSVISSGLRMRSTAGVEKYDMIRDGSRVQRMKKQNSTIRAKREHAESLG